MRRRTKAGVVPDLLSTTGLRPCPTFDSTVPMSTRVRVFDEWLADRAEWVSLREAHSLSVGWPGGELARLEEEHGLRPVLDGPFNPSSI